MPNMILEQGESLKFAVKVLRDLADRVEEKGEEELESYHVGFERTVQAIGPDQWQIIYKITEHEIVTYERGEEKDEG